MFSVTFESWLAVVDLKLLDFLGFSHEKLPIPKHTWQVWFNHRKPADFVAVVLANFVLEINYATSGA